MLIKPTRKQVLDINAPLKLDAHGRPKTRREFISQGFMTGSAVVCGTSIFSLFANPQMAQAALSPDLEVLKASCGIAVQGAGKIPFICFDLAGGANIAGSNVLLGGSGGQEDFLSTQGYSKLGLPGDMVPSAVRGNRDLGYTPDIARTDFVNEDLGLRFHADSGFMRGIHMRTIQATRGNTDGAVIAARSENDTGNNMHNPMYAINKAGADGSLLTLIGSQSSDSGGNSMAPMDMMDNSVRPTKVDRPSDVTGLVDVGDLLTVLSQDDAVAVMESISRISRRKLDNVNTRLPMVDQINADDVVKDLVECGYIKSADIAQRFGNPASLNPAADPDIVGAAGIFSVDEFNNDGEFRKTASVMKLVLEGYAGAGTITMGGYDYHTGERGTGEARDLRAGQCIGACLDYARRKNKPVMIYVFSDGSVASNGRIDDTMGGRGKGEWTGDNQSTACSFFLVYNPNGRPALNRRQIGFMRDDASVETSSSPAANNVPQLVQTVLLNYMALHGQAAQFDQLYTDLNLVHGLGGNSMQNSLIAFNGIVNGTIPPSSS